MCHRHRLVLRLLLALTFFGAFLARYGVASAWAQGAQHPLEGRYRLVEAESDDVRAAIERGTDRMNFVRRALARRGLEGAGAAYRDIAITSSDSLLAISMDGHAPVVSPADGRPTEWEAGGTRYRVRTAWLDGALRQTFVGDGAQRENLYSLDDDGQTLRVRVTLTSGQLPAPIVYTLVYRRVGRRG